MSEALAVIDVPLVRPPGVTIKQWRLAMLLPRCRTAYEAIKAAGYSESTARDRTRDVSVAIGTQRAAEAQAKARRDRAPEIESLSASAVVARLQPGKIDELHATELAQIWGGARKIRVELPLQDESGVDDAALQQAAEYIRNVVYGVLVATRAEIINGNFDAITPELIDTVAVKAQTEKFTQCRLSDAALPPPTATTP